MKKIRSNETPGYKNAIEYVFKLIVISLCNYYSETDTPRTKELLRMKGYFGLLSEMKRGGKALEIDKTTVDRVQEDVKRIVKHRNFNDQAIVAIVIVSGCRLICSKDTKSFPFLKSRAIYPKGVNRPSIYTGRRNIPLLINRHIVNSCGPCCK